MLDKIVSGSIVTSRGNQYIVALQDNSHIQLAEYSEVRTYSILVRTDMPSTAR